MRVETPSAHLPGIGDAMHFDTWKSNAVMQIIGKVDADYFQHTPQSADGCRNESGKIVKSTNGNQQYWPNGLNAMFSASCSCTCPA